MAPARRSTGKGCILIGANRAMAASCGAACCGAACCGASLGGLTAGGAISCGASSITGSAEIGSCCGGTGSCSATSHCPIRRMACSASSAVGKTGALSPPGLGVHDWLVKSISGRVWPGFLLSFSVSHSGLLCPYLVVVTGAYLGLLRRHPPVVVAMSSIHSGHR